MSQVKISSFAFRDGELRGREGNLTEWVWPSAVSQEVADRMVKEITRAGMRITMSRWRKCTEFRDEVARDFR